MHGNVEPLVGMFDGNAASLVIPVYQRNYDWHIDNCARLFDDLVDLVRHHRRAHFFGSIVYQDGSRRGEMIIIDGQQRLTTVNLLFLALQHSLRDGVVSGPAGLDEEIHDRYLHSKYADTELKMKLKPIKADADAYTRLFGDEKFFDQGSNVTANYRYFRERIARGEMGAEQLVQAVERLETMLLKLDHDDDAQMIFESLNSTGLDLSEADRIRNYILMGQSPKEQERLYDEYWNRIEQAVDFDTSTFVRHFLTARLGRTPRMDELYVEFKAWHRDLGRPIEQTLAHLRTFARHFRQLLTATTGDSAVDGTLRRHNLVDRSVSLPFLLLALDGARTGQMPMSDMARIMSAVDTYLARRWACGMATNSHSKTFALLHREAAKLVSKGATWADAVVYRLTHLTGSAAFPTDDEFFESLTTRDFYRVAPQQRNYFWESLENGDSKDVRDIAHRLSQGDISIEHVMPQKLTPAWRAELGSDFERIHATWLNRLGNLTVTGYNPNYSNHSFESKRVRKDGFADSPYRVNKLLRNAESWSEEQMRERGRDLANQALTFWPMPVSSFVPPRPPEDVEPMGEDADFTNRIIESWELHGVAHPVKSWKDMLVGVLQEIHTARPADLRRLSEKYTDLRIRPQGEERSKAYREIADGLDVYASTSTVWKIWLLRNVCHQLGLDTDDLIFHLRPEAQGDE